MLLRLWGFAPSPQEDDNLFPGEPRLSSASLLCLFCVMESLLNLGKCSLKDETVEARSIGMVSCDTSGTLVTGRSFSYFPSITFQNTKDSAYLHFTGHDKTQEKLKGSAMII